MSRLRPLLILCAVLLAAPPGPALAQDTQAEAVGRALEAELSAEEKRAIQDALVWSGDYDGRVDGLFGPATRRSISAFQERSGYRPTGYLRQRHLDRLFAERAAATERYGWEIRRFADLGMDLGIPSLLFREPEPTEIGLRFRSREGRPRSELLLYSAAPMSERRFEQLRDEVVDRQRFSRQVYDNAGGDWFVFSGRSNDGLAQYTYIVSRPEGVRGFSFRYVDEVNDEYGRLNVAMYNSLAVRRAEGQPVAEVPEPPTRAEPPRRGAQGRGQGVIVNRDGSVLTALAAVDGCKAVRVNDRFDASVAAVDRQLDLAALTLTRRESGYPHLGIRMFPVTASTDLDVFLTAAADGEADTDSYPAKLGKRVEDPLRMAVSAQGLGRAHAGAAVIDEDGRLAGILAQRDRGQGGGRRDYEGLNAYAAMAFLAFHGIAFGADASDADTRRVVRRATVGIACAD